MVPRRSDSGGSAKNSARYNFARSEGATDPSHHRTGPSHRRPVVPSDRYRARPPCDSEIELTSELHQPPLDDVRRAKPRRSVGVVLCEHRARIERVEQIEVGPDLIGFWKNFGSRIGEETTLPLSPPDGVDLRAARIRPEAVSSLEVRDLNIVVERLAPLADEDRFDLIVATKCTRLLQRLRTIAGARQCCVDAAARRLPALEQRARRVADDARARHRTHESGLFRPSRRHG
jgi:hypothetical protein